MNTPKSSTSVWGSPVIWVVSLAHAYSHLVMLALPPLFLALSDGFEVSFFQLGLLISGFNLVTALTQFSISRLIDRFGGPFCLRVGLALSASTMALAAVAPNFWVFALAYMLCGFANSVYHPADFRILNAAAPKESRAMAFSIHLTAGNIGFALAPAMLTPLGIYFGWRVALAVVVAIGLICLLLLFLQKFPQSAGLEAGTQGNERAKLSLNRRDIWLHLAIFTLFSVISGGIQSFSIVAGHMAFDLSTEILTAGLSLYLLSSGCGTLLGGLILRQFPRREQLVFFAGNLFAALLWAGLWFGAGNPLSYIGLLLLVGLASGSVLPARDMLISTISKPETQGQIYGFVTTGINIGQLIAPLIFGALLTAELPKAYFISVFCIMLIVPLVALYNREPRISEA